MVVYDRSFEQALRRGGLLTEGPALAERVYRAVSSWRIFVALFVAIVTTVILFAQVPPRVADWVAPIVPSAWEDRVGANVLSSLSTIYPRCSVSDAALASVVDPLADAAQGPYSFKVSILKSREVNAMAAPGGYVAVMSGLVEQIEGPDELAGVLAHEFEHVLMRHATRALLRDASLHLLIASAATGTGLSQPLETAREFQHLSYSRGQELEADEAAIVLLKAANINPRGLPTFLRGLAQPGRAATLAPEYLSTHPEAAARADRLDLLIGPDAPGRWRDLGDIQRFHADC